MILAELRVAAQALALKMADITDGLVLPHMQFTYPGAGTIGRGTVEVSPSEGLPYLKAIARSLLRQGFKFVGSTIMYAFMQATGMVNDHENRCFRRKEISAKH